MGTCWLGWFHEKRVRGILKLKKEEKPIALISLGYPAVEELSSPPRQSLEKMTIFNPPAGQELG